MPKQLIVAITALAALSGLASVVAGCGDGGDATSTADARLTGELVVSAAASLTESFTTIREGFVADNPDARVTLNFGSSGALSTQIQQGAPADVAAFADTTPMTALADAGLLDGDPRIFARNRLIVVTKPGNPTGIESLADLTGAGVVALCVETAPCGSFADQILSDAGVVIPAGDITRGTDVTSTLAAVSEGDAVAGIVYVTDAIAAGGAVDTVEIPDAQNLLAGYPLAVVAGGAETELAEAFVAYVLGDAGQATLADAGFLSP